MEEALSLSHQDIAASSYQTKMAESKRWLLPETAKILPKPQKEAKNNHCQTFLSNLIALLKEKWSNQELKVNLGIRAFKI